VSSVVIRIVHRASAGGPVLSHGVFESPMTNNVARSKGKPLDSRFWECGFKTASWTAGRWQRQCSELSGLSHRRMSHVKADAICNGPELWPQESVTNVLAWQHDQRS
jgi:hypothetical protein